jgi:hypothetical protein
MQPIDIDKYTEEEEKERETNRNKNKSKNGWMKLEQQWGTTSGGDSRKASGDEFGDWMTMNNK